mgnify:FL=1
MTKRISIDAEALELRLPEDRRILLKGLEDLTAVARKLSKPIIHELVDSYEVQPGSEPAKKAAHLLAVYDGPWVYYCEVEEGPPAKEEAHAP